MQPQEESCELHQKVSLTARPFFEKRGYIVEVEQKTQSQPTLSHQFFDGEKGWLNENRITDVFLLVVSFCGGCPIYTREKKSLQRSRTEWFSL